MAKKIEREKTKDKQEEKKMEKKDQRKTRPSSAVNKKPVQEMGNTMKNLAKIS